VVVENVLRELNLPYASVTIGEVSLINSISPEKQSELQTRLKKCALEIIENKSNLLVNEIKSAIHLFIDNEQVDEIVSENLSGYLEKKLNYPYSHISKVFRASEKKTVQSYYNFQRIERTRELLLKNYTVTEIAYQLNYSSVAHLANQFKKLTGFTPSAFKNLGKENHEKKL